MKNKWILIALMALLLAAAFCTIAITARIFRVENLPANFFAAFLGAVITGVITVVLLTGQSAAEEVKERNVKVFEKKSQVFQEYIDRVWEMWANDQKITAEEFQELTSGYYRRLMIFLDDKHKFKGKPPTEIIGNCISNIGDYVDKPCCGEERNEVRDNIIKIINVLSSQLGLGGQINQDIIEEHDKKMFPKMFRKTLLDAFNAGFSKNYPDVFKEGAWLKWELSCDKKQYTQDVMTFNFKKYSECGIHIGIYNLKTAEEDSKDVPEHDKRQFEMRLIIPRKFSEFNHFRYTPYKKYFYEWISVVDPDTNNLFEPFDDNDATNPLSFDFTPSSLESIRREVDFQEAARVLAERAVKTFEAMKVRERDTKLSIIDFMEKYYPREETRDKGMSE